MKNARKLTSILLLIAMLFMIAAPAMAADETKYSITIENPNGGHTYEAYQIFTGTLSEKSETGEDGTTTTTTKTLSDIQWGSSVSNSASLEDAAKVAEKLDTGYTGNDGLTLDNLLEMINLSEKAFKSTNTLTDGKYVIDELPAGYYLVKDKEGSQTGEDKDAYTEYIVKVVSNVTTKPKTDFPTVEKKVQDINDSTGEITKDNEQNEWIDSADYDIGDNVPFRLIGSVPDMSRYDKYKYEFHDTLSNGLTLDANSVKVYILDDKYAAVSSEAMINKDDYSFEQDGQTFNIKFTNLKEITNATQGKYIVVEYNAQLNENANIGSKGNPNDVCLTYSNNPNDGGEGTNNTPKDTVIVFTYKALINKVQPNPDFDKDQEPSADNPEYIDLTGADFDLYKFVVGEGTDSYTNAENKEFTGTWEKVDQNQKDTDSTGVKFTFTGLDDGYYKLSEVKVPDGFNKIKDIYFTVEAEHVVKADNPTLDSLSGDATSGEIEFTPNKDEGSLSTNVVNQSGATLPETGGIGTTIFYVVGAALVVGAGVLLVTKKRMTGQR